MKNSERGYRGYIASRPMRGQRTAQHIQNLVVRDYARRRGLHYLLSATEYAMDNCNLILNQVLSDLANLDGIIFYSMLQLPESEAESMRILTTVLNAGKEIHFAAEGLAVRSRSELDGLMDIFLTAKVMAQAESSIGDVEMAVNAFAADRIGEGC